MPNNNLNNYFKENFSISEDALKVANEYSIRNSIPLSFSLWKFGFISTIDLAEYFKWRYSYD